LAAYSLLTINISNKYVKIQDGGGGHHIGKSKKFQYISNCLTDLYKIWHDDTEWVP